MPQIDPMTAVVIQGGLGSIAVEMGCKLTRISYSFVIRVAEYFGAALTDACRRKMCECKISTPLQSGPVHAYVRTVREARGEPVCQSDIIMYDDPCGEASQGPDAAFCVPMFLDDALIGWSVTTAHHLDIGTLSPGSCGMVNAVGTCAEGLQFRAIKVYDCGVRNEALRLTLRANIRAQARVVGEMMAQIEAALIGPAWSLVPVERRGQVAPMAAFHDLTDNSESLIRDEIHAFPDGDYTATTYLDGFWTIPALRAGGCRWWSR